LTASLRAISLAVLLIGLTALQPATAQSGDLVVIVNASVPTSALDRNRLRAIYSMRLRTWPDGQGIKVFTFPANDPLHRRFCIELLRIFPYQLQNAWNRLIFSGFGQAPRVVRSRSEMEHRVATEAGAIGYLDRSPTFGGVRVVRIRP